MADSSFLKNMHAPPLPDQFLRIEDKYIVPAGYAEPLTQLITRHLAPSYLNEGTRYTLIESVYFDSFRFDFFRDHFAKAPTRHKLRLRRYAPDGVWARGEVFLEAKTKTNGISLKERMSLDTKSLDSVMGGGPLLINEELHAVNKRMENTKVAERVERINSIIQNYRIEPRVAIQYKRLAFEREGVRVTLDRDIVCRNFAELSPLTVADIKTMPYWVKAQGYGKKFSNHRSVILEVKHLRGRPQWLEEFMSQLGLSCTSFSKYCWGITNLVEGVGDA